MSASTERVSTPAPSFEKEIARDDSAIPYDGRSAVDGKPTLPNFSANASSVSGRIGSAPQPATRHVDRSMFSSSRSRIRFTQRAKAKFGAYAIVPLCRVKAWNHETGRFKKRSGGKKTIGMRCTTGESTKPMSPMSW